MSIKFEKISKYADSDLPLPQRGTAASAGYDFVVAEDTVIPPYNFFDMKMRDNANLDGRENDYWALAKPYSLDEMASLTKEFKSKVTLVPTGIKCYMPKDTYLELTVRSSTPLKHWLILANGQGIIDSDYVDNSANEGEIFFQLINLSPFAIELKRGDKIGQGIFHHYLTTDNDNANGEREGGFGSTS